MPVTSFRTSTQVGPEFISASKDGLSARELEALARDCHLYEILPGTFVASDTAVDSTVRLRALGANMGMKVAKQGVFARLTAAWVFGCAGVPDRFTMHVNRYHRPIKNYSPLTLLNLQVPVAAKDIRTVGELSVTSIERTAVDLAMYPDGSATHYALVRLLGKYQSLINVPAVMTYLETETARRPHVRANFLAAVHEEGFERLSARVKATGVGLLS